MKPEYLYHYTNLSSLAMILSNRTIRFNNICNVDDLQEQETEDINNLGRFCFISCWTDDSAEMIPMWKMYTDIKEGVRIRLRKFPFAESFTTEEDLNDPIVRAVFLKGKIENSKAIIPVHTMIEKGFISTGLIQQKNILFEVKYTSEKEELYPQIVSQKGDITNLSLDKLGVYKNTGWSFQREWRYRLILLPLDLKDQEHLQENSSIMVNNIISGKALLPFSYYDIPIQEEAFEDMEIVISPCMLVGNRLIVKNLVEKYNPRAKIIESVYEGKLA